MTIGFLSTIEGKGRTFWQEGPENLRGWITGPAVVVTWAGCLHLQDSKLDKLLETGQEPVGLLVRSSSNGLQTPFLDRGVRITVIDAEKIGDTYYVTNWMISDQFNRLVSAFIHGALRRINERNPSHPVYQRRERHSSSKRRCRPRSG